MASVGGKLGKSEWFAVVAILAATFALPGCSRQAAVQSNPGSPAGQQQLPFDRISAKTGVSPTALASEEIPVGTEFTIRLHSAVSSYSSRSGDSFEAVLDEPLVIDGETLIPAGTAITGKISGAKASAAPDDPGYLRVTVMSVALNGKPLLLQASSLFLKGTAYEPQGVRLVRSSKSVFSDGTGSHHTSSKADVELPAGRRLTFRLVEPLALVN